MPNRAQPHDRTALDRLIAKAEADALRRAAEVVEPGWRSAILALIPNEGA